MMYVGFVVLALAVVAAIVGFMQRRKLGVIIATPFKKTGEAGASNAEVSCEGNVQAMTPLTAPCSGRPCIYYEVEVKQSWEKQVATENGMKKKTGTNTAHTSKAGSTFQLDDGSGPVSVKVEDSIDGTFEQSFEGKGAGSGYMTFGQYQVQIGHPSEGHATSTKCVERIIPTDGRLFVLGKADNATIQKRDGMLGKIMLSTKGRDHLMGSSKRNMMIGFVAAGLMLPVGGAMAAFGDAPAGVAGCDQIANSLGDACQGRMHGRSDVVMTWNVTEPGAYRFQSVGTGTDVNMRLWPSVTVVDASNMPVFTASAPGGAMLDQTSPPLAAGTYTIRVNDVSSGYAAGLEGGAGFSFDVDLVPGTAPAALPELPAVAAPPPAAQ
ncbi:MAG: E3 ubiquitin ligase family protein [Myxococcota bacterium]|nr:E3 ubiquitin ligase family protein [Myxococcota bacterium]